MSQFYVQVDDLQKYLDKAVKLGGKVCVPPIQISPEIGWMAMFTDPDGNIRSGCLSRQTKSENSKCGAGKNVPDAAAKHARIPFKTDILSCILPALWQQEVAECRKENEDCVRPPTGFWSGNQGELVYA